MKAAFVLGRIIFGSFFLYSGINHFRQRRNMEQYAGSKGVPMPEVAVAASGAELVAGGASIILGTQPKWGAAAITGFLAGVSPMMHDFWNIEDPNQRMNEMINFTKNVALAGGALALMGMEEPWPVSLPLHQPTMLERMRRVTQRQIAA